MDAFTRWIVVLPIVLSMAATACAAGNRGTAAAAVAEAQAAVDRAAAEHALWTSAEDALRRARSALQHGDVVLAIEQAHIARKHTELGIAQKSYPLFR
ncbi:MAG TPA: hypothetical protein VF523_12085 [Burkholderiales bacterium]